MIVKLQRRFAASFNRDRRCLPPPPLQFFVLDPGLAAAGGRGRASVGGAGPGKGKLWVAAAAPAAQEDENISTLAQESAGALEWRLVTT